MRSERARSSGSEGSNRGSRNSSRVVADGLRYAHRATPASGVGSKVEGNPRRMAIPRSTTLLHGLRHNQRGCAAASHGQLGVSTAKSAGQCDGRQAMRDQGAHRLFVDAPVGEFPVGRARPRRNTVPSS